MISRLAGAVFRAILMVLLIVTPALMVPGTGQDTRQIVALFAFLAAGMVIYEYSSAYPGLVEFRFAPPFNRIRFVSLFITVFLLSVVVRGPEGASDLSHLIQAVGARIGTAMDFPYSPVNLVVLMLPPDAPAAQVALLRTGAGISYLVSLLSLAAFLFTLKVLDWPYNHKGVFNVWVNLPTFDPTGGGDVVYRLERDASINIAIGFLLPFLTPAVVKAADSILWSISITNNHTIVWTLAAWAFLPAGLFMRGIAMGRIASMIKAERARRERTGDEAGYQPT